MANNKVSNDNKKSDNNSNKSFTLKSGRKIDLRPLTLELRDDLLDDVEFILGDDGSVKGVSAMQKTISKWLRGLLLRNNADSELLKWSMDERTEAFKSIQEYLFLGEGNPST